MNRIVLFLAALLPASLAIHAADPEKPNVVFIFADDWGWGDLSCHGHPWLKTPNLDRLAAEGIDFQQFNVLNPVCSPSRSALETGLFPARFCIHQHFAGPAQNAQRGMPDWLDPKAVTLPRLLREAGYRTAHFGKWHLANRDTHGAPTPAAYGYDDFHVFNGGAEWPSADLHAAGGDAAAFIQANARKPFFVNVWLHETHAPHIPTKEAMERWKHLDEQRQVYAAVVTDGDNAVGRILAALKEAGVEQDTIVLFSSDNGPEWTGKDRFTGDPHTGIEKGYGTWASIGETGGLRGRKRSLFEGGVRTPFLVRWPGHTPAGLRNERTVVTAVDLLPTLCAAAGVALPKGYDSDGEDLLDALNGRDIARAKPVFWEWRGTDKEPDYWPRLAVREGDWKLAMTGDGARVELYQLSGDRAETKDCATDHPEIVARLTKLVRDWKATLPTDPDPACINAADRAKPAAGAPRGAAERSGTSRR